MQQFRQSGKEHNHDHSGECPQFCTRHPAVVSSGRPSIHALGLRPRELPGCPRACAGHPWAPRKRDDAVRRERSEEHTSELQSRQYLHSFPTRRSSDLSSDSRERSTIMTTQESAPSFARDIQPLFRPADRVSMRWAFDLGSYQDVRAHAQAILGRLASGTMPCDGKDRKSTRLNSSHANIYTLSLHDALPISVQTVGKGAQS